VQKVKFAAKVDFFTDSLITKNTYDKGIARARFAANSDVWSLLFATIADKQVDFNIYWMPSHSADDPLRRKLKLLHGSRIGMSRVMTKLTLVLTQRRPCMLSLET